MLGVYVHIPFCESKCKYCAFSSFVNKEEQEKYIESLVDEINNFAKSGKREIDSIYIGGGTPSVLPINLMEKLIDALKENFVWAKEIEFTIEANPCSLTEEKLSSYKSLGINRISIGVQSLENQKLETIGRRHTAIEAIQSIVMAKKYIKNVSCDMLIGLPNLNKESFLQQIDYLASLGINHISAYMLQVEDNTPLYDAVRENPGFLPDDDDSVDAYQAMVDLLSKKGFVRYEVSNFSLNGFESKHNLKYWTGDDYIGFGLGAHSLFNGIRFANASTFEKYYKREIAQKENLTVEQRLEEHIMLGLRCKVGIRKSLLKKYGYDIEKNVYFKEFIEKGILEENGDNITLNSDFYGVSNYIIVKLLP